MSDTSQSSMDRDAALVRATEAFSGAFVLFGQANGDLMVFDAVLERWVPLLPGALQTVLTSNGPGVFPSFQPSSGGVPGIWRKLGSGSIILASGVTTTILTFTLATALSGEQPGAYQVSPIGAVANPGTMSSYNDEVFAAPLNNRAHFLVSTDPPGIDDYKLQATQVNGGALPISYNWFMYGVIP